MASEIDDELRVDEEFEPPEVEESLEHGPVMTEGRVLAELHLSDADIVFIDAGASVAVLEGGAMDTESIVADMLADGLTAAEIFEILAPDEIEIPEALDHHPGAHSPADLGIGPRSTFASSTYGVSSTCNGFTGPNWIDFIENTAHSGFDTYAHLTNSSEGDVWKYSSGYQSDYRSTLCPTDLHPANWLDGKIGFSIQKRQSNPLGTWISVSSGYSIQLEYRLLFYDLGNAANYEWRTKMVSVDVGLSCHPQYPWICSNGSDEYHFSHMWSN